MSIKCECEVHGCRCEVHEYRCLDYEDCFNK